MAIFVLDHGAYTSRWIWQAPARFLRQQGHEVNPRVPVVDPVLPLLVPMMVQPCLDPLPVEPPAGLARTFIYCPKDKESPDPAQIPIVRAAARLKNDPAWRYRELPSGHNAMWEAPDRVAACLCELVNGSPHD